MQRYFLWQMLKKISMKPFTWILGMFAAPEYEFVHAIKVDVVANVFNIFFFSFLFSTLVILSNQLLLQHSPVPKNVPVLVRNGKPLAEYLLILEYVNEIWKLLEPESGLGLNFCSSSLVQNLSFLLQLFLVDWKIKQRSPRREIHRLEVSAHVLLDEVLDWAASGKELSPPHNKNLNHVQVFRGKAPQSPFT